MTTHPRVKGTCLCLFAHDLALAIDLDHAERIVAGRAENTGQRELIRHTRRAPQYFQFKPSPLRITSPGKSFEVGGCQTLASVDAVVYDFGAVSITYAVPFEGTLVDLMELSSEMYVHAALQADSRLRAEAMLETLTPALRKPELSALVEDYYIFLLEPVADVAGFLMEHRRMLAQILRAEKAPLSAQQVDEAMESHMSYGMQDAAIIDWHAAILIDADPQDAHMALEFANVELLEMRHLDDRLDVALDDVHELLERDVKGGAGGGLVEYWKRRSWPFRPFTRPFAVDLRRVSQLQMESSMLFEGVNNALKLLGDQYLAKVYRDAARRLHLPEWDASILRKLGALESIYEKLADRQTNRRMEVLEWIIIGLIGFEIVMSLVS
ncbi:MAG: hypothetical protein H7210_00435 [Pyrinomonadaceae bacterium]|nr:hypothetical protein [Phycisphaerales bacterium]